MLLFRRGVLIRGRVNFEPGAVLFLERLGPRGLRKESDRQREKHSQAKAHLRYQRLYLDSGVRSATEGRRATILLWVEDRGGFQCYSKCQYTMASPDGRVFRNALLWLIFATLLAFGLLFYPLYVIRPFRYQGPSELHVALGMIRWQTWLEPLLAACALVLAVVCWRASRGVWRKIVVVGCCVLACGFAALSRVNLYEMLFHPMERPSFSPANRASLDGGEEVIAVKVNGAARAYPIRSISYHHIVNDVAGGTPIVATY
jgi:Protein of unknown function (DUF3179)